MHPVLDSQLNEAIFGTKRQVHQRPACSTNKLIHAIQLQGLQSQYDNPNQGLHLLWCKDSTAIPF
ncbi:hypothetical protein HanLR1_Chr14g0511891 [Helianthus annuus]|nr:hypothetical protein HanLR1_Chr14g0511891 [Helianthus annuus]